jgi:3-methyladenine DNA glycosylase AlkD
MAAAAHAAASAAHGALVTKLQRRLDAVAVPATRVWWEKYMRGTAAFRGVKMADIRSCVHSWWDADVAAAKIGDADAHKGVALELMRERMSEDKLAGVVTLAERLRDSLRETDLPRFQALFDEGHLADWNVVDWLCVKVLGPLAQRSEALARGVAGWKRGSTIWQRRAASVSFVYLAARGDANFSGFTEMLVNVCETTIKSSERFAQTGVGWPLRELASNPASHPAVVDFVRRNVAHMSRECLQSTVKKMPANLQRELAALHKAATPPLTGKRAAPKEAVREREEPKKKESGGARPQPRKRTRRATDA